MPINVIKKMIMKKHKKKSTITKKIREFFSISTTDPRPPSKQIYEKIFILVVPFFYSWQLIQSLKIHREKNVEGLSLISYIIYMIGSIFWFIYGMFILEKRNYVIIISSIIAIILTISIIVGIILYDGKQDNNNKTTKQSTFLSFI